MPDTITTGGVHHLRLTVTDVDRARAFYTEVLGFTHVMDLDRGCFLTNRSVGLIIRPHQEPASAPPNDRFDENRVGLDHLSFRVRSRDELEEAVRILDSRDMPHGEIKDLGEAFRIYVLAFRDPDNMQLELTTPYA
jgi:glyoxylase I family protein